MQLKGQAALLLEQPYGVFGTLNPTGHAAIYLARVCAETHTTLRRCNPGELGVVISRYQGIDHFDWLAIPVVPNLYSVEAIDEVPVSVDKDSVKQLRTHYFEKHLHWLGNDVIEGNFFKAGWTSLVGSSFDRRIYAYRFNTTEEQDNKLIASLNSRTNHIHFNLVFKNCADFSRRVLDIYFPGAFNRSILPDAGITTPKHIAAKLVHYAKKHPELNLEVLYIPQIPGYRKLSRKNYGIAETFVTTGYAIPLILINPYLAAGLFIDYLIRGRAHLIPKNPKVADAAHLSELTGIEVKVENPTGAQAMSPPYESTKKASQ